MNICNNILNITEIESIWQFFAWLFASSRCDLWVYLPFVLYVFVLGMTFCVLWYFIKNGFKAIIQRFNNFQEQRHVYKIEKLNAKKSCYDAKYKAEHEEKIKIHEKILLENMKKDNKTL